MSNIDIQRNAAGITFKAKIVPGSSKTALAGLLDGMVKVKISAAPEKGKANQCRIEYLAGKLNVKKNFDRKIKKTIFASHFEKLIQ